MSKNFDDLFNEFFNNKSNSQTPLNEEIQKIVESLISFTKAKTRVHDDLAEAELGEPDEVIEFIEKDMNFKRLIWNTPQGKFVRIVVTDVDPVPVPPSPQEDPLISNRRKHSKSLEQRLKDAVEVEDYELAVKLRDEIKKNRKKK